MVTRVILLGAGLLAAGAALAAGPATAPATSAGTPAKPPANTEAPAGCPALTLRLEEEIGRTPHLKEPANEQAVRDLRTLRDAAIVLDAYKYAPECARLSAILRELLDNPRKTIGQGGDTDEEKAEAIEESRAPKAPATTKK
ncbi:photosystem reaction center subunit H [Methylobacterium sp. ID0610]|uniref:photosystem reaction center subunit H n=1 Tax=Methylobacterium carpenticola TaxID=3344827 RepID=UPI0036ADDA70